MKFKSAALLNCLTQQPVGSQIAAALLRRIQMSNRIIDFLLSVIRKRELDISNEQTVRQQRCSQSRREHRTTGSTQCKRSDCTQLALDHWLSRISHLPFLDHFFSIISASAAFLSGVSRVQSLYYKTTSNKLRARWAPSESSGRLRIFGKRKSDDTELQSLK